jgi:hypothetical protein
MITKTKYPEIVQEIHRKFEFAGDHLLCEAKAILAEAESQSAVKGEILSRLGFKNTKEAKSSAGILEKKAQAIQTSKLVVYYQQKYPLQKFITKEMVEEICAKYRLICADVSAYTGFVPNEKLKQIDAFSLKAEDLPPNQVRITKAWGSSYGSALSGGSGASALRKDFGEWLDKGVHGMKLDRTSYIINPSTSDYIWIEQYEEREMSGLKICAPKKDMSVSGMNAEGLFSFMIRTVDVPDPVVLQPVKGGFLVIAAWGDEASDPIVVNQINN